MRQTIVFRWRAAEAQESPKRCFIGTSRLSGQKTRDCADDTAIPFGVLA